MDKINLLVPMAGRGQRFVNMGFHMPKPLVMVDGKHIIDWSFESIDTTLYNLIFCVRKDHIRQYNIDEILKNKFGDNITIVVIDGITDGSVSTCLLAEQYINNDTPLAIYTLDVYFDPSFDWRNVPESSDGHILTFKANNPAYSYAKIDNDGYVTETAEKQIISHNAASGIYYYKKGKDFVSYANKMIEQNKRTKGEFYICPLYNLMIEDGKKITISEVDKMHVMGTPDELDFFRNIVLKTFGDKKIALCSDHSGYELKKSCVKILDKLNIKYIDFGCYTKKDCDYNVYVDQAAEFINRGDCDYGFAFCRTGQGVNIAANKQSGIRSALVFDEYMAEMAVRHNCANFFSFAEKYIDSNLLESLIKIICNSSFDGGRHTNRVKGSNK
jgi:RpiB/LacA/LacB family sugar-phosphate isomerase